MTLSVVLGLSPLFGLGLQCPTHSPPSPEAMHPYKSPGEQENVATTVVRSKRAAEWLKETAVETNPNKPETFLWIHSSLSGMSRKGRDKREQRDPLPNRSSVELPERFPPWKVTVYHDFVWKSTFLILWDPDDRWTSWQQVLALMPVCHHHSLDASVYQWGSLLPT